MYATIFFYFSELHFLVICSGVMEDYVLNKKSIVAITKYPTNPTTGVGHNAPHILIKENNQLNLYVRGTANEGEMYKFSFDEIILKEFLNMIVTNDLHIQYKLTKMAKYFM